MKFKKLFSCKMCFKMLMFFFIFGVGYNVIAAQQNCADVLPTLCPSMSTLCNNSFYQAYMGLNCRLTCQLCTPSPPTTLSPAQCYDSLPSCSYSASLCNYTLYLTFMSQNCPVTCGLCVPRATTTDSCSDKSLIPNLPSSCSAFSSLCTISVFQASMKEYCPKTCGFCTSTISPGTTSTPQSALG